MAAMVLKLRNRGPAQKHNTPQNARIGERQLGSQVPGPCTEKTLGTTLDTSVTGASYTSPFHRMDYHLNF